ncbi:hypothetical protein HMPREF0496_1219 [Lentilactobacillus hilgardii ATCC 27305]|nr:hypothetical protein HMPREF0496_1219 [Lentilactobacillus hilgardii ATCC 27305]
MFYDKLFAILFQACYVKERHFNLNRETEPPSVSYEVFTRP